MAPFDIREVRELMEGDGLELEKIGDRKTALRSRFMLPACWTNLPTRKSRISST
jgi:hypothetical protein